MQFLMNIPMNPSFYIPVAAGVGSWVGPEGGTNTLKSATIKHVFKDVLARVIVAGGIGYLANRAVETTRVVPNGAIYDWHQYWISALLFYIYSRPVDLNTGDTNKLKSPLVSLEIGIYNVLSKVVG